MKIIINIFHKFFFPFISHFNSIFIHFHSSQQLQTLLLFRLHEKFTNNLDARAQVDAYIAIVKLVKQWKQRERDEARGTTRTKY